MNYPKLMYYPNQIEANGNIYQINTDYRVALSCFRAIYDDEINDTERALAVITLLLGKNVYPDDYEQCLEKCAVFLRCGKTQNDNIEEADMDYLQDEKITKTSIRQCYHLNLNNVEHLHWYEYNELIEGLTEESLLNKIRELRTYDLSDEKDEKRKNKIEKAKQQVVLHHKKQKLTEEQVKSIDKFLELTGIERK